MSSQEQDPIQNGEVRTQVKATFACPYCSVGAERYGEVFSHGGCKKCGGPLGEYWKTVSEKGEAQLKKSILILARPELKDQVGEVIKELESIGVYALNAQDIVEGMQPGEIASNLSYLLRATHATLVCVSPGVNEDSVIGKCLDEWMVAKDEGKNIKVAPLYFPQYSDQHAPFGVQGNVGVFWGEESWRSAITKTRFFEGLQKDFGIENSR